MTRLLDIGADVTGVIRDSGWEIIPLISALRWFLGDHLYPQNLDTVRWQAAAC